MAIAVISPFTIVISESITVAWIPPSDVGALIVTVGGVAELYPCPGRFITILSTLPLTIFAYAYATTFSYGKPYVFDSAGGVPISTEAGKVNSPAFSPILSLIVVVWLSMDNLSFVLT